MRLIDTELNNIKIECEYFENNNIHMKQLYLDANDNLIFKIYFFPKYIDESIREKAFIILQNDQVVYKFNGNNLSRQTEIRYKKNKILKNVLHIYYINLYKNKLFLIQLKEYIKKIEKNLIQTHESISYVPKELLIYNTDMNPEYKYYFFSNNSRRRFIKHNYEQYVLNAYDLLIPGTFRGVDLFRLLVLNKLGGVFLDHKCVLIRKLENIVPSDSEYFFVNDIFKNSIYPNPFIINKGNRKLIMFVDTIVKKILNRHTSRKNGLEFGPTFYKEFIDFGDEYDIFFNHINLSNSKSFVRDLQNQKVMYVSFDAYYKNRKQDYGGMYFNNLVYYDNKNISKYKNYFFYLWNHPYSDEFEFEIKNNNLHVTRIDKQEGFAHNHIVKIVDTLFNKEKLIEIGPSEKPYKIIPNVF